MTRDSNNNLFSLELVDLCHPMRNEVEDYIRQRYSLAFDAQLNQFMPLFLALTRENRIESLCGVRTGETESLFLEQYLDRPAHQIMFELFGQPIDRTKLIEFGQLASFSNGMSPIHFLLMTRELVRQGYEWCIFTATDPLYAMMCRLGLEPVVIMEADPERIPDATITWGQYYRYQPRIMAGNLSLGLAQLEAVVMRRKAGGE